MLFEGFYLKLDLLQVRFLRLQDLDAIIFIAQLALPRVIEIAEYEAPKHQACRDKQDRQSCASIHLPAGRFRFGLSEKVYANHG